MHTVKTYVMDVRAEKLWLIDRISKITDERLLKALKSLMEFASQQPSTPIDKDFWDDLSEAQKGRIELSIKQLEAGEGIPHKAVISEFRTKYRRAK